MEDIDNRNFQEIVGEKDKIGAQRLGQVQGRKKGQ